MTEESRDGYRLLSRYRGELMGLAMLYVMLFHAYELNVAFLPFKLFRSMGFAGVDLFLVLSGMGICCSLTRREQESYGRYLGRRLRRLLADRRMKKTGAGEAPVCVMGRWSNRQDRSFVYLRI